MSRGAVHVFVGPSLAAGEVTRQLPGAVVHPPVAHGDLLRLPLRRGDRVLIVDGVFHQSASVRHKEVLDLLRAGVRVSGAASMGALRAAELAPFGMAGHGVVHRLYALGVLTGDDEVALVHDDGGDWTARTAALVSVRLLARRERVRGALTAGQERLLVAAAAELPYPRRSWAALLDRARRHGLPAAAADRVRAAVAGPVTGWDVKARDALAALRALRAGEPAAAPGTPAPDWAVTGYLARWRHPADGPVSMLVTAAALVAADYPRLHYRTVLAELAGTIGPLPELEEAAVAAARRRGLIPPGDLDSWHRWLAPWLAPGERHADATRLWARVLVRSYRWAPDLAPLPLLQRAVEASPAAATLRALTAAAARTNAALRERGHPVETVSRAAVRRLCLTRWSAGALAPVLHDRGFVHTADLYRRVAPLCAHLLLTDPPPVRLTTR